LDYKKISSYIFKPSNLDLATEPKFQKAYELWNSIWSETFNELVGLEKFYSDDFLRSHEVSVLFYDEEPISVFLYNQLNMKSKAFQNLSYFKNYPEQVFEQIKTYENIMVMGYLTVSKNWRKSITNISFSDVHVGLAVKRFLNSNHQALISFTRNNRKINDVVYRFGAKGLLKEHTAHNVSVDYILIDKFSAKNHPDDDLQTIVDFLWENYKPLTKENLNNIEYIEERRIAA